LVGLASLDPRTSEEQALRRILMVTTRSAAFLAVAVFMFTACNGGGGATTRPSTAASVAASTAASAAPTTASVAPSSPASEAICDNLPAEADGDLLATICERGTIRMSTDPAYPPQSELKPDGTYQGFDISVGQEIADRLGVDLAFETPAWEILTAGSWGGRWDFSVGSMTITSDRQDVLDFTQPYYSTPAQMAVRDDSDITSLDGLAGKVICVGEETTYLFWLEGTLDFGTETPETTPPEGSTATTLPTDRDCAEAWRAGREEFDGWLSSSTTVADAIADGLPIVAVGEPVFHEPLAAALDKSGPDHDQLLAAIDGIIADMHEDGTLSDLSVEWLGSDMTAD
jgi:polar amino acid transport system substrate-binding protein